MSLPSERRSRVGAPGQIAFSTSHHFAAMETPCDGRQRPGLPSVMPLVRHRQSPHVAAVDHMLSSHPSMTSGNQSSLHSLVPRGAHQTNEVGGLGLKIVAIPPPLDSK